MSIKSFLVNAIKVAGVFLSFALVFRKQLLAVDELETQPAKDPKGEKPKEENHEETSAGPRNWFPSRFQQYFTNANR